MNRLLLDSGADVNKIANSGGTAVMYAAGGGHLDAVLLLLSRGADVNVAAQATLEYIEAAAKAIAEGKEDVVPHKDGVTALSLAAQGGHEKVVEALVTAGARVDTEDEDGVTPLAAAFKGSHFGTAEILLENGANANDQYTDDKGVKHFLLFESIAISNTALSLLLIEKGANVAYVDADGVPVLTQAAYQGMLSVVQLLMDKGADPQVSNEEGINALIAASSEGHHEVVNVLLASGKCDVNSHDKDGTNALMAAAVRGHEQVIRALLAHHADINAQNADGHTPLMFAYNGKSQVQTLLEKYREFMPEMNDNSTRIINEALNTHTLVVKLLVEHGADVTLKVGGLFSIGRRHTFPVARARFL